MVDEVCGPPPPHAASNVSRATQPIPRHNTACERNRKIERCGRVMPDKPPSSWRGLMAGGHDGRTTVAQVTSQESILSPYPSLLFHARSSATWINAHLPRSTGHDS